MGTQHPTLRERAAIKFRADQGDESAQNYLKLLDGWQPSSSNGISLARGLMGEHDDTYGEAIDDALSELVPLILEIAAGGWDSLRFYARPDQLPKEEQK
jgi:hypothetical protein